MSPEGRRRERLTYERRILLLALLIGLPGALVALILLWTGEFTPKLRWTLGLFIVLTSWAVAHELRNRVVMPLQTFSNLLAALREGDFSIRLRGARYDDALGQVMAEINALTRTLHEQRLDALEATTLLRKVMEEIDVAVFAFDEQKRLRLVNRAGQRLLGRAEERLIGLPSEELELGAYLDEAPPSILEKTFPGGSGRWEVRRSAFRQGGLPLQMLVLSDVSRALRQEERTAWQRLIRVFSHELRNSLTPIQSITGSLKSLLIREPRPDDWQEDMHRGLSIIGSRSEGLNRFLDAYARLARLPEPKLRGLELKSLVQRVARLETRLEVSVDPGPDISIDVDGDQLEQLLINLIRNAVDAVLPAEGEVRIGWSKKAGQLDVWVEDDGPGVSNTANLFVPFFTTKPSGSGVGLVLCRQIAEAHGGSLTIRNRQPGPGCEARLRLPP